jgi:hypothetical protein
LFLILKIIHRTQIINGLLTLSLTTSIEAPFYIAFAKHHSEGCYEPVHNSKTCGLELSTQIYMLFFVNDLCRRCVASLVVPFLARRKKALATTQEELNGMGPIEKQVW